METAKIVLASLLSYAALFLSAKLIGRKQVSQLDFLDYITGITIGSIGAELATDLENMWKPLVAIAVYALITWLLLLCAVLFSFQIMAVDHFSPQMDGVRLSLVEFFVVSVESTVAAFLFEQPAMAEFVAFAGPILYCGIMSSGVAYTLQILGQRDLNPAVASLIMCLESVFSALGGWLLLHQNLSFREASGCVLLFAAVVLAQLPLGRLMRSKA